MSASELILDEQALGTAAQALDTHVKECRTSVAEAVERLLSNSESWNDEDFADLVSAVNAFTADVEELSEVASQLIQRIGKKQSAIRELHSITI